MCLSSIYFCFWSTNPITITFKAYKILKSICACCCILQVLQNTVVITQDSWYNKWLLKYNCYSVLFYNMLSFAVHCIFLRILKSKNFRQELESYAHFFECSGHISGIFMVCFWSRSKLKDFQHVFVPSFYADETLLLVLFCFVL